MNTTAMIVCSNADIYLKQTMDMLNCTIISLVLDVIILNSYQIIDNCIVPVVLTNFYNNIIIYNNIIYIMIISHSLPVVLRMCQTEYHRLPVT